MHSCNKVPYKWMQFVNIFLKIHLLSELAVSARLEIPARLITPSSRAGYLTGSRARQHGSTDRKQPHSDAWLPFALHLGYQDWV
ncbi:hypothetical protein ASPCAL14481 [Aspergillus calidoustus]|uniref:Uncharacterized protein n=1 Tax=Aspergillus calidoustus TaxID=454130 RepID=A0A0U5GHV1_ASPCI|nr:hypothetical protein ASPCAL14481 [Aspergillus calidoustus]